MDKTDSNPDVLLRLENILKQRKQASAETSYVASLYQGEHPAMAEKITEEAAELIEAALSDDKAHTVREAADLLFHCQVLLAYKGISINAVLNELERRIGVSGHDEKRRRSER